MRYAGARLAYGPLADRFGRRPMLLTGMAIYLIGTLACSLAPSITMLLVARFVQALGGCAGPVIGRAVVRDLYAPEEAARILSYMASAMALAAFVVIDRFAVPPTRFGWYFGIVVEGYGIGAFLGGRHGKRLGLMRTLGLGIMIGMAAGLVLSAAGWLGIGGLVLITVVMAVYFVGCGLLAQATVGALAPLPQMARTAADLLDCVQMLTGMVVNALSSVLFDGSERPMVTLTAACAFGALLAYGLLVRHRQQA